MGTITVEWEPCDGWDVEALFINTLGMEEISSFIYEEAEVEPGGGGMKVTKTLYKRGKISGAHPFLECLAEGGLSVTIRKPLTNSEGKLVFKEFEVHFFPELIP